MAGRAPHLAELHTDAEKAISDANDLRATVGEALIDAPPDAAAALDMPARSATFGGVAPRWVLEI